MHRLADEGRTVFVSSHLLSDMSQTAQDLVVIGRGKLIYQGTVNDFVDHAAENTVLVRSPRLDALSALLHERQVQFAAEENALRVSGVDSAEIGELATANGIVLHELNPQVGSLEEAFMRLTGEAVEFHGNERTDTA